MGVTINHGLTATTPDNTSYEIRPSHWNDTHAVTFAQNWQATGNTTQSTSGSGDGMYISGVGLASVGVSNNSLIISVPAGAPSPVNFSAGTTSNNLGSVVFSNSNGVSFGLNGSTITASAAAGAADGGVFIAAGTRTAGTNSTVLFDNANGITFGLNAVGGSILTASHNGLTSQSNQAFSADASSTFQTLTFQNSNGFTFSNNAGAIRASYSVPVVSNALQSVGSATGSGTNTSRFAADDHVHAGVFSMGVTNAGNTVGDTRVDVGRFVLQGGNNVTLSQITAANALNTIIISGGAAGGADGINALVVNGGASTASTTLTLSNSNNVSFGHNAGVITATATFAQSNQTGGIYVTAQSTGQSSSSTYDLRTLSFVPDGIISAGWSNGSFRVSATQSNQAFSAAGGSSAFQTLGFSDNDYASWTNTNGSVAITELRGSFYATSNTTQSSSGTINLDSVIFQGAGVASVGVSNGSVIISVPAGGGGLTNINVSAGTTSQNLSNIVFSNSNGVSFGLNGSTITGSVNNGTLSMYEPWPLQSGANAQIGNAFMYFRPFYAMANMSFSAMMQKISVTVSTATATGSSHAGTLSFSAGLYTRTSNSLSLASSGSQSYQWTNQSNNSISVLNGLRQVSLPLDANLTPGDYWVLLWSRSSTANLNRFTASNLCISHMAVSYSGSFLSADQNSYLLLPGWGFYTSTTGAMPDSVGFSQITAADGDSAHNRCPWINFVNFTAN